MSQTFGLSKAGFRPKDFHSIKNEMEDSLKKTVDPTLRFSSDTIAGQLTGIIANQIREIWEEASGLYLSLDCNFAEGRALDALCSLTGTYRKQALPSRAKVLVTLATGTTLPRGIIICDENNLAARFKTISEIQNTSQKQQIFETEAIAEDVGPTHVEAGKLTKILTPHAGLISITNPESSILGQFTESDEDLRLRRIEELSSLGASTLNAMTARLLRVKDVEAVFIEEKLHQFCAYVMEGDEQDIADTIWQYKPLGIHTYGNIAKEVKTSNGQIKTMYFCRPEIIALSLHLKLKVRQNLDEKDLSILKSNVASYCRKKFSLGAEPYPSQIYPVIFAENKILDVINIQLKRIGENTLVPEVIKAHELIRIDMDDIYIEQIIEVAE